MGRQWTAVVVALSACFLVVVGDLDWFVLRSELPKLSVDSSTATGGERETGVCIYVCVR